MSIGHHVSVIPAKALSEAALPCRLVSKWKGRTDASFRPFHVSTIVADRIFGSALYITFWTLLDDLMTFLLFLLLLLIPAQFAGCQQAEPAAAEQSARIIVEQPHRTLPSLLRSEVLTAEDAASLVNSTFKLTNVGETSATVVFEGTGCQCYGAELDGTEITRGDTFEITPGGWRHLRFLGKPPPSAATREFNGLVRVMKEEQEDELVVLKYSVAVYSDVTVIPQVIVYPIGSAEEKQWTVTVKSVSREPDSQKPILSNLPDFLEMQDCELQPTKELEPGIWEHTAKIQLAMGSQPATLRNGSNWIHRMAVSTPATADKGHLDVFLHVHVRKENGLSAPEQLRLGTIDVGKSRKRKLLVRAANGQPFTIADIITSSPAVTFTPVSDDQQSRHFIDLAVTPQSAGPFHYEVTVAAREFEEPVVISLTGYGESEAGADPIQPSE